MNLDDFLERVNQGDEFALIVDKAAHAIGELLMNGLDAENARITTTPGEDGKIRGTIVIQNDKFCFRIQLLAEPCDA